MIFVVKDARVLDLALWNAANLVHGVTNSAQRVMLDLCLPARSAFFALGPAATVERPWCLMFHFSCRGSQTTYQSALPMHVCRLWLLARTWASKQIHSEGDAIDAKRYQ